jgi:hypothetical protein
MYKYKKLNTYLLFVSLILSLLIYHNKVYNKEIYIFKFDNLNYKKISNNFYSDKTYSKFLEYNTESLEDIEKDFKTQITKFFSSFYFFTNTLSNNVMYDPNDVDLFAKHFTIPGKTDFKKKKIFYETFKNYTNYNEFLTIDISGEYFKKQNNFYLKYVKENFLLFVSKKEFESTKRLIKFSRDLVSYSESKFKKEDFDDMSKIILYLNNIYLNQINENINLKKISIFYELMFHFIVLIILISGFFLIFKFIFIITNFIKYKFYDHEINSNFIN